MLVKTFSCYVASVRDRANLRVRAMVKIRARVEARVMVRAMVRIKARGRARVRVKSETSLVITESTTRIKSPSYLRENSAMHVLTYM